VDEKNLSGNCRPTTPLVSIKYVSLSLCCQEIYRFPRKFESEVKEEQQNATTKHFMKIIWKKKFGTANHAFDTSATPQPLPCYNL
jgi:hypothetical protein